MWSAVDRHGRFVKLWSSINFVHILLYKYIIVYIYYIYIHAQFYTIIIYLYLAHQEPTFFFQKQFFLHLWKKTFFLQLCCSLLGKKPTLSTFFSHLVSWHLMIRSLRGFKPLYWYWLDLSLTVPSILIILPPRWLWLAALTRKDPML